MSAIIDNAETIRYQRQVSIAQTKSQSGVRQAQRRGPLLYNFFIEIRPLKFGSNAYFAIEDEILDSNYSTATIDSTINNGNLTLPRGLWSGTPTIPAIADTGTSLFSNFPFNTNQLQFGLTTDAIAFMSATGLTSGELSPIGFTLRSGSVSGTPQDFGGRIFTQAGNRVTISGTIDQTLSSSGNLFWNIEVQGNSVLIETGGGAVTNYARKGDFVQFSGYTKVFQLTADSNTNAAGETTLSLNGAIPASSSSIQNTAVVFGKDVTFHLQLKERPEPEFSETDIVNYSSATFEEVL